MARNQHSHVFFGKAKLQLTKARAVAIRIEDTPNDSLVTFELAAGRSASGTAGRLTPLHNCSDIDRNTLDLLATITAELPHEKAAAEMRRATNRDELSKPLAGVVDQVELPLALGVAASASRNVSVMNAAKHVVPLALDLFATVAAEYPYSGPV
jgi:hypothetical protein